MEIRERDYYRGLLIRHPLQLHMGSLPEFGVNLASVLRSKPGNFVRCKLRMQANQNGASPILSSVKTEIRMQDVLSPSVGKAELLRDFSGEPPQPLTNTTPLFATIFISRHHLYITSSGLIMPLTFKAAAQM